MPKPTTDFEIRLMQWIDDAATALHQNLHDGYTQGYEYRLADEISERLTSDDERKRAIRYIVYMDCLNWPVCAGALDECEEGTYTLLRECADRIADLSMRQIHAEPSDIRLRQVIAGSICEAQRSLAPIAA